MPGETRKLAMIGCGLIARAHGLAAERSDYDVAFTACSSRGRDSAQTFAEEFGCAQIYDDHQQLLAGETVDGIVIAAPPQAHIGIISDCLDSGVRFILCEKPLAMNGGEARAIRDQAAAAGAVVLEGFMYRYHPQIAAVCELIESGELGEVDHVSCAVNMLDESELGGTTLPPSWRRESAAGGVMHDFLCYPVDFANLVIRAKPERALARTFESPVHGTTHRVFGMIEYDNGALASVAASRLADFSQPSLVACNRGTLRLDTLVNPIGDTELVIQRSEGLIGLRRESMRVSVPVPVSERLIDLQVFTWQLDHFVDLINGAKEPRVSMSESLKNACVRDALISSGSSGGWCDIDYSDLG